MAKKSWLNLVSKFFIWDKQPKQEKIEKRRTWIFGRLTVKRLPSLTTPSPTQEKETSKEEKGQCKHALTVAIVPAAAAAHVAVDAFCLTGVSESVNGCKEKEEETPQTKCSCQQGLEESAATKIQAAFRASLARKALQALKGIVKLQGLIRGRLVRRQAAVTLKCLQSIVSIQSEACARRFQLTEKEFKYDEQEEKLRLRAKIIRMDSIRERRWDDSVVSKQKSDVSYISKKEAMIKREKIKENAFRHRKSAETERSRVNGRWMYWLEQWVDTQLSKSKEFEDLDSVVSSICKMREEDERRQPRLRNIQKRIGNEGLVSPTCMSRKSPCQIRQYSGVDNTAISSPRVTPTYMTATESAKAKARSASSPKLRPIVSFDACSDSYSSSKNKLSLVSSRTSEAPTMGRMIKLNSYQQRSPSFKGTPVGPVKTIHIRKDLSLNIDRAC